MGFMLSVHKTNCMKNYIILTANQGKVNVSCGIFNAFIFVTSFVTNKPISHFKYEW